MQEEIRKCQEKENDLIRLLNAKACKMADAYLTKKKHTQLSYLNEAERNFQVAIAKGVLLDRLIAWLKSV